MLHTLLLKEGAYFLFPLNQERPGCFEQQRAAESRWASWSLTIKKTDSVHLGLWEP